MDENRTGWISRALGRWLMAATLAMALQACVARTALDIVTLPIKATSAAVDAVTVSQSEADQKRGRALRRHEECLGKEARRARSQGRDPALSRCPLPGG